MDFEDIIEDLGAFGHWQRVIFVLICLADVFGAFAMLVPVFSGATPAWSCSLFQDPDGNKINASQLLTDNQTEGLCIYNGTHQCVGMDFHDDFSSIVSEWDLVCNRAYVSDLITSIQMVGLILGAAVFGQLSDTFGRKKCYFGAFTLMILFGIISGFSPRWEVFAACRFFVGVGFGALMVVNCVYPLEFVGRRWRTLCGTIGFWAVGGMILALCGYFLRKWQHLILLTSCSGVLFYFTWIVIPESPRWLVMQNRYEEAEALLLKIAHLNKTQPPDLTTLKEFAAKQRAEDKALKKYTYLDLFRTWKYCRRALLLVCVWFTVFIMYYGLTYNLRNLSGNRYLNMFLGGFLDLLAMMSVILFNNVIGRRLAQVLFLVIAVLCNIVIISVIATGSETSTSLTNLLLAAALLGKAVALSGTYVVQIWTAELFPTAIRNQAMGLGQVGGRIGAVLSPQIVFLSVLTRVKFVPHVVTTVLSVLCLPLTALLPETNGEPLEDAFEESRSPKPNTKMEPAVAEDQI